MNFVLIFACLVFCPFFHQVAKKKQFKLSVFEKFNGWKYSTFLTIQSAVL